MWWVRKVQAHRLMPKSPGSCSHPRLFEAKTSGEERSLSRPCWSSDSFRLR